MERNFNLPPGTTLDDLDPTATPEDYSEREYELADRWQDAAIDREYYAQTKPE